MDAFCRVIQDALVKSGVPKSAIYMRNRRELPGFSRAEKQWDLAVVFKQQLVAAVEVKSQVGSFGNNFNNRSEEAVGNAADLRTAYREGAFAPSPRPWIGYLMLLEDSPGSQRSVRVKESHFKVFEEFRGASYARRYELLLLRLVREQLDDSACLVLSSKEEGRQGKYTEPLEELSFQRLVTTLVAHATGCEGLINRA